jgi:molybdenum cofactor cytidylyltransferase
VKLSAVVLAAGFSRRMGREKVLLPFGGSSILGRILANLAAAGAAERIVVLRPDLDEAARIAQRAGARVVINEHPEQEMLLSIRMGIADLSADAEAFYVWPADHPAVAIETLRRLARAGGPARVALPVHDQRRGHPVLIGAGLVPHIAAIPPNEGLRHLWRTRPEVLVEVPVDDSGVLVDLNTPEDYEKWTGRRDDGGTGR